MKKICIIFSITCIILSISCTRQKDKTFQIIETYHITTSSGLKTYLSVDLPISGGYQSIGEIIIDNIDSYNFEQREGYQKLLIEITGDGTEKAIIILYEIKLLNGIASWDGDIENKYLMPSEFIDSDNHIITTVVKTLINKEDKLKTAQNISKYVSENVKFDNSTKINQKTLLASEVLEKKEGVCGDYANLMTALLRASGIPAKSINGLVLNKLTKSSDWGSPAGSHAWVEFYIYGKWYFDDPTWGNNYFTNTDGYHLSYGTQPVNLDSQANPSSIIKIKDEGYTIIGASTAPLKFVSWSEDQNATITPKVEITKR